MVPVTCFTFTNHVWERDQRPSFVKVAILMTWQVLSSDMFVRCTSYGTGLQIGYFKELHNCYHCIGKFSTLLLYNFW